MLPINVDLALFAEAVFPKHCQQDDCCNHSPPMCLLGTKLLASLGVHTGPATAHLGESLLQPGDGWRRLVKEEKDVLKAGRLGKHWLR